MRSEFFTSGRGDRSNVRNVGIVVTDGQSNDPSNTWREARQARAEGIQMVAVGIGVGNDYYRLQELRGIASWPTSRNVFNVNDFNGFNSITSNLLRAICNNDNDCGSNPCRNGGRCVDGINGYRCNCQTGYTGINCDRNCNGQADVVFVIDASGSIRNNRFVDVLTFISSIVTQLEVGSEKTRIGAIKLSDSPTIEFHLNTYSSKQDVIAHINRVDFIGKRTNIADTIQQVRTQMFQSSRGARDRVPNFMIMFTDGSANIKAENTIPEAIAARNSGIHVIVVSVGKQVNTRNLNSMASIPSNKNIFTVQSYNGLPGIVNNVVRATCNDVNECSSNPCQSGGQCVDSLGRFICRCSRGRAGERCERTCNRQRDITFVLDLSGSVEAVTNLTIDFTRRVIYGLDIDNGQVKVGLVSFTNAAKVNFYLDAYNNNKQGVLNAVAFPKTKVIGTNTQEALRFTYQRVFESNRGDRGGVANIAIVLTDGKSNIQRGNTANEANNLRRESEIYAIGVGTSVFENELNAIASDPDTSHVLQLRDTNAINTVANNLLSRICQ